MIASLWKFCSSKSTATSSAFYLPLPPCFPSWEVSEPTLLRSKYLGVRLSAWTAVAGGSGLWRSFALVFSADPELQKAPAATKRFPPSLQRGPSSWLAFVLPHSQSGWCPWFNLFFFSFSGMIQQTAWWMVELKIRDMGAIILLENRKLTVLYKTNIFSIS